MKTVEQLKSQIYFEVEKSGFLKNVQSQVKNYVLDLIDKETKANKQKLGFEYQHPVLKKLRNYPLTSLCMDLIQEFLESFKFKHTLNVFKKEVNRDLTMSRQNLVKQFNVDLSGKDQSVLLSIVGQLVNGDVRIIEKAKQDLNGGPKRNNFMNEDPYNRPDQSNKNKNNQAENKSFNSDERSRQQKKAPQKDLKNHSKKYEIPETKPKVDQKSKEQLKKQEQMKKKLEEEKQKQIQRQKQIERQKQLERLKEEEKQKEKQKQKGKGKKAKKQQEKPPEGATDLLADVMGKFKLDKNNKKSADQEFKARKAFSQQKEQKKIVPQESGTNKIRGISMGKMGTPSGGGISSFMKFSSFNNQATKNESVDEQFDELQQSKDSTRRNPLYSSSESGFDKSNGYDQSVDSMAIQDYEYVEKAKKFAKKL